MIRFANNVSTKLFSSVLPTDTQIILENRAGESLPVLINDDDYFMLTLQDEQGNLEIVKCTHFVGDVCTVERAQEGTAARSFTQGSIVEQRLTAGSLNGIVEYMSTQIETISPLTVPKGMIAIWSGQAKNIPDGWHLCDGNEGTIDLRDKFVLGSDDNNGSGGVAAGNTYDSNEVTIAASTDVFTPTINHMPYHNHGLDTAARWEGGGWVVVGSSHIADRPYTLYTGGGQGHSHTLSRSTHKHEIVMTYPSYYQLAFIQKL